MTLRDKVKDVHHFSVQGSLTDSRDLRDAIVQTDESAENFRTNLQRRWRNHVNNYMDLGLSVNLVPPLGCRDGAAYCRVFMQIFGVRTFFRSRRRRLPVATEWGEEFSRASRGIL